MQLKETFSVTLTSRTQKISPHNVSFIDLLKRGDETQNLVRNQGDSEREHFQSLVVWNVTFGCVQIYANRS